MENQLMKKRAEMTLKEMSDLTGLTELSLSNISKFQKENIMYMRVGTILKLKEKLGVNMLEGISDYSF